jgi:hypothetical protein
MSKKPTDHPFSDFPIPPPITAAARYVLRVAVTTGNIDEVMAQIRIIDGVDSVAIHY